MGTNLLKDVIADADAIKKLAIENAKASLNEAFDSKIKSMIAAKLNEDAEEDYQEGYEEKEETDEAMGKGMKHSEEAPEETDESFDIDAILAEMEDSTEEEGEPPMKEAKRKPSKEMPSEEEEEEGGEMPSEEGDDTDENFDLDEILYELKKLEDADEAMDKGKYEDMDEGDGDEKNMEETYEEEEDMPKTEKDESYQLQEVRRQINELAKKVNETNLINAKLLYLNKILRNHNLSEHQKLKVVAAFDKAESVKEAKIVYESLNEALNIKVQTTKTALKESLGFASKASGTSTKREIITEADAHVARWQKLAGIRK